jgi:hypothetical protein
MNERFGRYASSVEAGSADLVFFDQCDGFTELGGAESARISA